MYSFSKPFFRKPITVLEECFQTFFNMYLLWHAASNNGINLFKIIINNRNYNLKGINDNYIIYIYIYIYICKDVLN